VFRTAQQTEVSCLRCFHPFPSSSFCQSFREASQRQRKWQEKLDGAHTHCSLVLAQTRRADGEAQQRFLLSLWRLHPFNIQVESRRKESDLTGFWSSSSIARLPPTHENAAHLPKRRQEWHL